MFDEIRGLLKHSLIYGISNILRKAIGFLMIPVYTRYLTTSDYGTIQILDLIINIAGIMFSFGVSSSIFRFYYQYDNQEEKNQVISTAYLFIISIIALITICLLLLSKKVSILIFSDVSYAKYLNIIFCSFLFMQQENIFYNYLLVNKKSVLYTIFSSINLISSLLLNIYFVIIIKIGIIGILYASLISHIIGTIVLGCITLINIKLSFSLVKLKEMLKYGIPLIPSAIGMFLITFADRFFLQKYSSLSEVGIYSLGYNFGYIISFLVVQPFLLTWQAQMFEIAKKKNAEEIFSRVFTYCSFILILTALALSILSKDLLKIIATPAFFNAYKVIPIIASSYVLHGIYFNFYVGFLIEKKTKYVGGIVGFTAVVNIILNFILIPKYNMYGAALATFLSFLVMVLCAFAISRLIYFIKYEFLRVFKLVLIAIVIYWVSITIIIDSLSLSILINTMLILAFLTLSLVMGFFTHKEISLGKKLLGNFFLNKYEEKQ